MATQTFKVDVDRTYAALVFVQSTPKTKFGTDEQDVTKDGLLKWTVELLAATRDGRGGARSEVLKVGMAARTQPGTGMDQFTRVGLGGFEVGVMEKSGGGVTVYYRADELLMADAERTAA